MDILTITSNSGPNLLPIGTFKGRPVELRYVFSSLGDWQYTDDRRDWIAPGEIEGTVIDGVLYTAEGSREVAQEVH